MRFQLLVCLTRLLWLLAACGGAAEEPTPSVGELPTAVATAAVVETSPTTETIAPTPEPAATEPAPIPTVVVEQVAEANFNGVSFFYDQQLITAISAKTIPARLGAYGFGVDGAPVYYWNVPDFVQFTLETAQKSTREGLMVIQPVRDAEGNLFPAYNDGTGELLLGWEDMLLNTADNPFVNEWPSTQAIFLDFANGEGVRQVIYMPSSMGLEEITNQTLFYNFQGFTSDGRYYVWVQIPLSTSILPEEGTMTMEELIALANDPAGQTNYYNQVFEELNNLLPDQFTPSLSVLDNMIATLVIPAEATTVSSLPQSEVGCFNNAQYVADVTIPDGTTIEPRAVFTKTWEVRNTGSCIWNAGYFFSPVGNSDVLFLENPQFPVVNPGETAQVTVVVQAPSLPGYYRAEWQLSAPFDPAGAAPTSFGNTLYLEITVNETAAAEIPTGRWQIGYFSAGPVAAMSNEEAQALVGQELLFTETSITWGDETCMNINYTGELVKAGDYMSQTYQSTAEAINRRPSAGVDVIRTNCAIAGLGEFMHLTDYNNEIVIVRDGIFFFLMPK